MTHGPLSDIPPRWLTEFLVSGIHDLSDCSKFCYATLCLYGKMDTMVVPSLIQQFIDSITSQEKAYIAFPDGRHRPLHEDDKNLAVNNMFQWLDTRL